MKLSRITYLLFFLTCFTSLVRSQETSQLGKFSAAHGNGVVLLNWEIVQGFTCNGTTILRAGEDLVFEPIGEIDGICGSIHEPVPYNYTDFAPIPNSINHYYLKLGDEDESEIQKVEVTILGGNGYRIHPQPINDQGKLYFDNPRQSNCELHVFSMSGKPVLLQQTNEDEYRLDTGNWPSGVYFFRIILPESNSLLTSGKFIVQH